MASALDACRRQYEADLAWQTSCCALRPITAAHRAANRRVFEQLASYQSDLDAKGRLPYHVHDKKHTSARRDGDALVYPDDVRVSHHRQLTRIVPLPDVHKHSDCDLIYRFLIARRMNEAHAVQDLLHYIAFREKYALDTILWDREVESLVNGLDGEELMQVLMNDMASAHSKHGGKSSKSGNSSNSNGGGGAGAGGDAGGKKTLHAHLDTTPPPPRPLLQPGWATWNCGVDRQGNVLCYQRPCPRDLLQLLRRWPHVAGAFDRRDAESYTNTPPYCNLLVRLYLRGIEKGRRLSLLLHANNHDDGGGGGGTRNADAVSSSPSSRSCLSVLTAAGAVDADATVPCGAVTCLIDVAAVKLSHLTSSKYKPAVKLMRMLFSLSQVFYPENLARMIVVNGGAIFGLVYKLVRPLLDTQTQRKIVLLSETHTVRVDELRDVASPHADERDARRGGGMGDDGNGNGNDDKDSNSNNKDDNVNDDEDDDDDDDDEDGADEAAARSSRNRVSSSALHKTLMTYVDDRFVPTTYGGRLAWRDAPICYGGTVPRALSAREHFAEAAARVAATVVPELLPDDFLLEHADEGAAVTATERAAFAQLLRARLAGRA